MNQTTNNLSKEKEIEEERFSCLIRYLRYNSASKFRILKKWDKTKGKKYIEFIEKEIKSNRHIKQDR